MLVWVRVRVRVRVRGRGRVRDGVVDVCWFWMT